MQLHLETDELDLLANILMERIGGIAAQTTPADSHKTGGGLAPDSQRYNDLLDRVLARDLKFDCEELDYIADLLTCQKQSLREGIGRQFSAVLKTKLQKTLAALERTLEKVDEACAMI